MTTGHRALRPCLQLTAGASTVNGHPLTESATVQALRPLLGFVGKEDIVDRRLTARELLTLSAQQVRKKARGGAMRDA